MSSLYRRTPVLQRPTVSLICFLVVGMCAVWQAHAANETTTFSNVSTASGVDSASDQPAFGNPVWVDLNDDGLLDVFVVNHGQAPSVFENNGNETFTDIRASSGITRSGDRHGASFGDFDSDGDLDLFITLGGNMGNPQNKTDQLYRNDGNSDFTDITATAGVSNVLGRGRSVNWVDFNNDGELDLFLNNLIDSTSRNVLYENIEDGTFTDVTSSSGLSDAEGPKSSFADYDNDGDMDVFFAGAADQLFRNNGDGTFTDVTSQAGDLGRFVPSSNQVRAQGIAWGDYNNNGNIDIYVARGSSDTNNALIWDASEITFSDEEKGLQDGLDFKSTGGLVQFNLYIQNCHETANVFYGSNNQSPPGIPFTLHKTAASGEPTYTPGVERAIYIWHDSSVDEWHIRWSNPNQKTNFYGVLTSTGDFLDAALVNNNRVLPVSESQLYRNNGDGTFTDVTAALGLTNTKNNRGATWGDFDNDGDLDLYVVNSGDFRGNGSNRLYRNTRNGTSFINVAPGAGAGLFVIGRGEGAAFGDFNNDGFLDLYVNNGAELPVKGSGTPNCLSRGDHQLLKNRGNTNGWLKLELISENGNRGGIGTQITLHADGDTQFRQMNGSGGEFLSQGSGPVHFGLGGAGIVDLVSVLWPSGHIENRTNVVPGQLLTIVEDPATPNPPVIDSLDPSTVQAGQPTQY